MRVTWSLRGQAQSVKMPCLCDIRPNGSAARRVAGFAAAAIAASALGGAAMSGASGQRTTAPAMPQDYLIVVENPLNKFVAEIVDRRGRLVRVVTAPRDFGVYEAHWSPDRSRIAWVSTSSLSVQRADGARARVVLHQRKACAANSCDYYLGFAWLADSRRLVVAGVGKDGGGLAIVSVNTGSMRTIAPTVRGGGYHVIGASPNGRLIAYIRIPSSARRQHAVGDLVVAKADGGSAKTIFRFHDRHDEPSARWSPDSRSLAFTTEGRSSRDPYLATIDVATGRLRRLTGLDASAPQYPAWSPDSKRVAATQVKGPLATVDTATGKDTRSLGLPSSDVWLLDWSESGVLTMVRPVGGYAREVLEIRSRRTKPQFVFRLAAKKASISSIDPR